MKLHLPVLLRKALLACFSFSFACSEVTSAADLTLGDDASLAVDYADLSSITDLASGTLTLAGGTELLLSNCGEGDGKTYTLLTGVGGLLDAEGNVILLDSSNNAIESYFDTTQPGTGFWGGGWLQLTSEGHVQLVLHGGEVQETLTISTRQTGSKTYNYYEGICFRDITYTLSGTSSAYGGAIYGESDSTITLSNNGSVSFSGNTASSSDFLAYGGAINGKSDSTITLSNNGSVVFTGNKALASEVAQGGAIYGDGDITLCNNGSVRFCGNSAFVNQTGLAGSYSPSAYGGAINSGRYITLDNNDCVEFVENEATGVGAMFYGGAIYGNTTLRNNGSVTFRSNKALRTSGDVPGPAEGGAIYGSAIALINNESVTFSANISAFGGAISGNSTIMLINNGSVAFSDNNAVRCGGAIYADGNLSIQNNDFVLFERNVQTGDGFYRLHSVYADYYRVGYEEEKVVSLSAAENKSIEFRDSIFIDSGRIFNLNGDYIYQNADGASVSVNQRGDIIFTGETTIDDLFIAKGNVAGTAEEILASRTSEVKTIANLYNGRLIIKEDAIWSGDGITVASAEGKTYKPTLLLQNGHLSHYEPSDSARNVVTIKSGATLEVAGKNTACYTSLILEGGSTLTFNLSASNTSADAAVLSMSDSSLTLPLSGTVTLKLVAFDGISDSQAYALLTGVNQPASWNNANITVASGTNGWDVSVADLCWDGTTLWLYYDTRPDLEIATWTNESKDGKWNTTSLNWEQNEVDYEYKDGVAVVFGDTGADTVTLVGNIAPKSVLVDSAEDYTWEADPTEGGKLTGSMELTKKGSGTLTINISNDYTGETKIEGGTVLAGTATALGTGAVVLNGGTLEIGAAGLENSISNRGTSRLQTSAGITHVLIGTISNTGTLTLSGSFDASALDYETNASDERYALDGSVVGADKSGFAVGVTYQVKVIDGGTVINDKATILHDSHAGSNALVLGADGYARANGDGHYSHYFLTNGDAVSVGEIAQVATGKNGILTNVNMDSGSLTVDQSIIVSATDGSIAITKAATLDGSIEDTAVSTAAGSYSAEIRAMLKGDTTLEINGGEITVSGANSYTGGTMVNGGTLMAGHNNALGSGDVTVNGAALDLNDCTIANKVFMNGTSSIGHANGASHIVLGSRSQVNFRDGFTLSSGKTLEVAAGGAAYTGALTLGGGTLLLADKLTVQGNVLFEAGKQTTIDISGWTTADDGTVLVDFGSSNRGYADGCLTLSGIAGDWELVFDAATGLLTLAAVQNQPVLPPVVFEPNLDRNQQEVYDTMKDIMADGNPGGVLGLLGQNIVGSRDEAALKRALDEISGRESATIMSSQIEGNLGHLRRLRAAAGMGTPLGEYVTFSCCYPSNKGVDKSDNKGASVQIAPSPVVDSRRIRAGVSAFHEQAELDADANGDGFERSETGAQLTMEYLVSNDFVLGMGLSHSRTKLTPTFGKRRDEDNTHVDLYGVYQSGRWSSTTALGVGLHQHDLGRTVAGMQTEAEADGLSVNFMQELAYSVYADEEQGLQVFGSVESSFNQVDAFSETGAGNASLCVEEQDAWVTDVTLGLRYNHTLPALGKAPAGMFSVQGGVVASLGDTEPEATLRFAGAPGYSYKQYAAERSRWGYNVGVSVNLPVSASTAVFGTAEAVLRNNAYTVDAQVGVKMAF